MKRAMGALVLLVVVGGCAGKQDDTFTFTGGKYLQRYQAFHTVGKIPPSFSPWKVAASPVFVVLNDPDTGPMLALGVDEHDDGFVDLYLTIPMDRVCLDVLPNDDCSEGRRVALNWYPEYYQKGRYSLDDMMAGLQQARLTCNNSDLPAAWQELGSEDWPIPPCSPR